jgi:hypothetical protein
VYCNLNNDEYITYFPEFQKEITHLTFPVCPLV